MIVDGGGGGTTGIQIGPRLYTQVNVNVTGNNVVETPLLFIGGFNFNIPPGSIISGLTISIKRRSLHTTPWGGMNQMYCYDGQVRLTKDKNFSNTSQNYAMPWIPDGSSRWPTDMTIMRYPQDVEYWYGPTPLDPLWGTTWTPEDIMNENFGVILSCFVKNNTTDPIVIPQIECVSVCVAYLYNDLSYNYDRSIYMDNNLKFDTELSDFGMIDEFVYSKVNENKSILKINPDKDTSMYPMIDEYGYTYSSRFIFKSPWDKEFFVRTNSDNILNYSQMVAQQAQTTNQS